ncbi:MAG TPA: replication initiation protein, partial [Acidiferrobacteraceae bacterium]|nr:replication initiation protein [Acidiferrobacteraceae bacterium]
NGCIQDATRLAVTSQPDNAMGLTLDQRTNINGVPKAAELIEITGAHALEASDRAILNLLYQHAHDSGRLGDANASWELPITALRPSRHNGTDRVRDSLSRLLSVQVKVMYRDSKTGRDRVLMTHLFESFDLPADEGVGGPVRYRVPVSLVPVLAQSSRWGRIKAETVCAMSSKYAIALYEMVQLRGNMDRCLERFALDRFRDLLGVPPGAYERGNDFVKRVIDPAVVEVNGLSEYGVKVDVERPYSRAPISGVLLGWWRKDEEEFRATSRERQRPKQGRMARLKGSASADEAPAPLFARLAG